MGRIVVVAGPPGAGKSVVADELVRLLSPSALVPGDDFFGFLRNGAVEPWLAEADAQNAAVTEAAAAATGRLSHHCDVVYEGVVGPWFLPAFLRGAGVAQVHYALLLPPVEVCLERVRTRRGHGFTDVGAARHMWSEMASSGVAPRHLVPDTGPTPAAVAARVAGLVATGAVLWPTPAS